MSTALTLPITAINGQPLTGEQSNYLTGFFAGIAARGQRFGDVEPMPAVEKTVSYEDLIFEERVKRELHPLDAYPVLIDHAATNKAPEKEEIFRFKWNGLFYLTPNKEAFMARLRIPGGLLRTFQLRELANVAKRSDDRLRADHHTRESANPAHPAEGHAGVIAPHPVGGPAHPRRGRG